MKDGDEVGGRAPIRALVVDDSAFMRKIVATILRGGGIDVADTARDGVEALEKARAIRPDVVTLDLQMPRMDGVAFLRQLMLSDPTPVVVLSSLTEDGAGETVECLELGAFACLHKPSGPVSLDLERISEELVATVRSAARANRRNLTGGRPPIPRIARPVVAAQRPVARGACDFVVAIASSTGGPAALQRVVPRLPADLPACVVIVQHLPRGFAASLAESLGRPSALTVREARVGDTLERGTVLLAPGGAHTVFDAHGRIAFRGDPPEWSVRPAADYMMRSAAERFGARVIGVVLTGMGRDGADGARAIRDHGGFCIAQDEATSVIYGMPREAVEAGGADRIVPLGEIATAIQSATRASSRLAVAI